MLRCSFSLQHCWYIHWFALFNGCHFHILYKYQSSTSLYIVYICIVSHCFLLVAENNPLTGLKLSSYKLEPQYLHVFPPSYYVVGATEEPEVIPDPAKQTDRVVKIAGISAGVLVFILLVLVAILLVKKRWVTKPNHDR